MTQRFYKTQVLIYYNEKLLERGLITRQEYRQMDRLIRMKYPPCPPRSPG